MKKKNEKELNQNVSEVFNYLTKEILKANEGKQEEFISIKLIAEIPINVIMKNNDILVFLRTYSRIED